jgi:hypothetical protein
VKIKIKPPIAKQLIKEIEEHLPLPVYASPQVSISLRQPGKNGLLLDFRAELQ